jgi:hypothetical protein
MQFKTTTKIRFETKISTSQKSPKREGMKGSKPIGGFNVRNKVH